MNSLLNVDVDIGTALLVLAWLGVGLVVWRETRPLRIPLSKPRPPKTPAPDPERLFCAGVNVTERIADQAASGAPSSVSLANLWPSGQAPSPPPPTLTGTHSLTGGFTAGVHNAEFVHRQRLAVADAAGDLSAVCREALALVRMRRSGDPSGRPQPPSRSSDDLHAEELALLKQAVVAATQAGRRDLHAEARMELAELAAAHGDMTTACEHWQLARMLFQEAGLRTESDRASEYMRRQRCPTDWFLTGF